MAAAIGGAGSIAALRADVNAHGALGCASQQGHHEIVNILKNAGAKESCVIQ